MEVQSRDEELAAAAAKIARMEKQLQEMEGLNKKVGGWIGVGVGD